MDEDSFQCPRCGRETLRGAHFCMGCGTRLEPKTSGESGSQPKAAPVPPPLPDGGNWLAADLKPSKVNPPPLPTSKKPAKPAKADKLDKAERAEKLDKLEKLELPPPPLVKSEPEPEPDAEVEFIDAGSIAIEQEQASPSAGEENPMGQYSRDDVLKRLKLKQSL